MSEFPGAPEDMVELLRAGFSDVDPQAELTKTERKDRRRAIADIRGRVETLAVEDLGKQRDFLQYHSFPLEDGELRMLIFSSGITSDSNDAAYHIISNREIRTFDGAEVICDEVAVGFKSRWFDTRTDHLSRGRHERAWNHGLLGEGTLLYRRAQSLGLVGRAVGHQSLLSPSSNDRISPLHMMDKRVVLERTADFLSMISGSHSSHEDHIDGYSTVF